ncbi:MAG TPA: GNAT family N-acetyltransferase [Paludibacteraceae bacterium]|nr:GNAT family N-acetyltransferase [Paludibacteraceae bacterium]
MESDTIKIMVANESHYTYIDEILSTIEESSKDRGTGIAKRSPEYVKNKMAEGKAIIALDGEVFAGFCYIESWGNKQYVANSGLIVNPKYRGHGVAKKIKKFSFDLSRQRFPNAKLFGLTSGAAVMKINTELGYVPVTFADLTDDEEFWKGCQGCVNFDVLQRTNRRYCICTAMLYDPNDPNRRNREEKEKENEAKKQNKKSVITDFINKFKKLK